MKVAVVTGICVERDAISAAAANQAELISSLDGVDDVTLVAHAFDRSTSIRQIAVADSWDLLRSRQVASADLVVFHWGIRYDLFNALIVLAEDRSTVVHFHNLTPAHLVDPADRATIDESLRQIQLPLMTGSEVWTESQFNLDTLFAWGFSADRVRFMPFPVDPLGALRPRSPGPRSDGVRLLTVGRLVPAKGVDVLLESMAAVVADAGVPVRLVLAGSAQLSDDTFLAHLADIIEVHGLTDRVEVRLDLSDEALWDEYCRADVLVVPSLHEGLCVPVIEAYMAGCRVVATDAGNLRNVVQPPDRLVPTADAAALAAAIVDTVAEVAARGAVLPAGAAKLVETYSRANTLTELQMAIEALGCSSSRPRSVRPSRSPDEGA